MQVRLKIVRIAADLDKFYFHSLFLREIGEEEKVVPLKRLNETKRTSGESNEFSSESTLNRKGAIEGGGTNGIGNEIPFQR